MLYGIPFYSLLYFFLLSVVQIAILSYSFLLVLRKTWGKQMRHKGKTVRRRGKNNNTKDDWKQVVRLRQKSTRDNNNVQVRAKRMIESRKLRKNANQNHWEEKSTTEERKVRLRGEKYDRELDCGDRNHGSGNFSLSLEVVFFALYGSCTFLLSMEVVLWSVEKSLGTISVLCTEAVLFALCMEVVLSCPVWNSYFFALYGSRTFLLCVEAVLFCSTPYWAKKYAELNINGFLL